MRITASVGLAFFPAPDIASAELLVKFTDEALYQAKRSGRNTICVYQARLRYEAGQGRGAGPEGCREPPCGPDDPPGQG